MHNLDDFEKRALLTLAARELWAVDELPDGIDADLLGGLDAAGYVEAQQCKVLSDHNPLKLDCGWFSPIGRSRERVSDWGWAEVLRHRTRDAWDYPWEIRLSDAGRAEVARLKRAGVSRSGQTKDEAEQSRREWRQWRETIEAQRPFLASVLADESKGDVCRFQAGLMLLRSYSDAAGKLPDPMLDDETRPIRSELVEIGERLAELFERNGQDSTVLNVAVFAETTAELGAVSDELLDRAEVWERMATGGDKAGDAPPDDDDGGVGGTDTDWKDVQCRLLAKRDRGEPYTSLRKLSDEFKCSDATIRKAIEKSVLLKGWKARSAEPKSAPKATDLGAVVRDNKRQTTEPAPDDVLPDDDVDATMAWLIDQARPDERATLNALDGPGRRALVAAYQSQNLDAEPSPLESDKPGNRARKVKQRKRA